MTIKEFEIQLALGTLSYDMKRELAYNLNTPKEVLTKLSTDKHWSVRWRVANNSNTPVEVLTKLSTDEAYYVRSCVARNPSTPVEVLTKLSTDEDLVKGPSLNQ